MSAIEKIKETRSNLRLVSESKKDVKQVSMDNGFTQIPNELLFAMGRFQFTQRQYGVLLAVIQKTLSWHKETDWICNDQLAELANLYDHKLASKVKNELIEMNVLIQKGKQIGVNLDVSTWKNASSTKDTKIVRNVRNKSDKSYDSNRTNHTTTKETITKYKINNTPLPPTGESAVADGNPQAVISEQKSAKPKSGNIDYQAVADLYNQANEDTGSRLPMVKGLNDKRKRAIKKFLKSLKHPTLECAEYYFGVFFQDITPHQLGQNDRGWRATFDFAIREDVVLRVREGAL